MENESLKHLFQQEFSKMVAVISNLYGLQHIETAEDIVSETFLLAAETWGIKGIPKNPAAWLYVVAKQKTLAHFRRKKIYEKNVVPELASRREKDPEMEELNFSTQNIRDSQLQMLFAICTPSIASEAQIGLALRILCGFGIDEIAEAFLSNKETINKRLFQGKGKIEDRTIEDGTATRIRDIRQARQCPAYYLPAFQRGLLFSNPKPDPAERPVFGSFASGLTSFRKSKHQFAKDKCPACIDVFSCLPV
jgi:predicted RNA polymerase sigma factor